MRGTVLALTMAMSFGVAGGQLLPMTVDRAAPAAAQQPGESRIGDPADPESLDALVALVHERLDTADAVAAAKWATVVRTGQPPMIDDPVREAEVYDAMAAQGADLGLPEPWVRQVFEGQIEANKIVQRGLHARWRADPRAAPATPPDLAAVRPVIDRVNGDILRQLAQHRSALTGPDGAQRLVVATAPELTSGRVDALHGTALLRGTGALWIR